MINPFSGKNVQTKEELKMETVPKVMEFVVHVSIFSFFFNHDSNLILVWHLLKNISFFDHIPYTLVFQ